MRSMSTRVMRAGAVVTLLAGLPATAAHADEPGPLENRIRPPIGAPAAGDQSQVRVSPPIGAPVTSQNRILPPIGGPAPAPSQLELFWRWLQAQAKIRPPIG